MPTDPTGTGAADLVLAEIYETDSALLACSEEIGRAFELVEGVLSLGGQILVCGNGGSASDSEHIAGELAKSCALPRPLDAVGRRSLADCGDDGYLADHLEVGFPVVPLVCQSALITAVANDQGGDLIFAQQVFAYGRQDDLLWVLSTSGTSPNVIHALRTAKAVGMRTLGFSGPHPREMQGLCDVLIAVPGQSVPAIQHAHQLVYHALCIAVEAQRFAR
jgi:D-sedoheptulose 7-phosphate isomerase